MKISMQEAAINLERICDDVENCDEIDPQLSSLFHAAELTLGDSIERRMNFLLYAQGQARHAGKLAHEWRNRERRFEYVIEKIKEDTLVTMKKYPNIPFSSMQGSFKIQRNSVPSLELISNFSEVAPLEYIVEKVEAVVDCKKLKEDLTEGKQIDGASLKYGEHLRISLRSGPLERN
jgi:hypothetical protein